MMFMLVYLTIAARGFSPVLLGSAMLTLVESSVVRDMNADKAAKDMMDMEERIMNKVGNMMSKMDVAIKRKVAEAFGNIGTVIAETANEMKEAAEKEEGKKERPGPGEEDGCVAHPDMHCCPGCR
jgi:hypothetical protein